jgi:hypothetical protein
MPARNIRQLMVCESDHLTAGHIVRAGGDIYKNIEQAHKIYVHAHYLSTLHTMELVILHGIISYLFNLYFTTLVHILTVIYVIWMTAAITNIS